jgi:type II secretory pathway component GspD/PulD (secretin)
MSKIGQKYVFLCSLGLLCLFSIAEGCGWSASTPITDQVVTDELIVESIEPVNAEPVDVVEIPKNETILVEIEPVMPEPPPEPVVVAEEPEPQTGVRTDETVDQESPVDQTSPVNTDSPVNERPPVQNGGFTLSLLRWIPVAILVLQEDNEMEMEETTEPMPLMPVTPPETEPMPPMPVTQPGAEPMPPTPVTQPGAEPVPLMPVTQPGAEPEQRGQRGQRSGRGGPPENMPPNNTQRPPNGRGPAGSAPSVVQTPRLEPAEKIRFFFRNTPWKDVIEWFADQAALSLQADKMPTGTLNLTDGDYYTPTEGLDILNYNLQFKDYALVRKGKTLFVLYLPDKIPANLLEPILPEELESRGKYEICRVIFTLNRTTPEIIQAEITGMLGPQGDVLVMPKSQQIAVTETGAMLRTIREIIRRIDDPESMAMGSGAIQMVELRNLTAEEALQMMRTLLAIDANDVNLRTAADPSGKKILLSGRGDMIERARDVLKRIDISFGSDDPTMVGQPQFETYDVGSADPTTVFAVLQTLLAGIPDVRLQLDPRTNGILVRARPAVQMTVRESIKQMQLNAPQVVIIPLKRMSPVTAVETIKKFYLTYSPLATTTTTGVGGQQQQQGGGGGRGTAVSSAQAPTVEADTLSRQIIVRGTLTQITEIRSLLTQLGEDGTVAPLSNISTVRTIPLSPTATSLVLEQLQSILPKLNPNIKVNVPDLPKEPEPIIRENKNIDDLIDETFEPELPMTRLMRMAEQPILAQVVPVVPAAGSQPEVNVMVTPGGIVLQSDDPEALAKMEELIRMLSDEAVLGRTVFREYDLVYATASVVQSALNSLMGTSASGSVTGVASVDLPEWQQSEMAGWVAQGNAIEKTGTVTMSVDERLNALFVQANAVDHKTIEKLIKILDRPNRDDILNRPTPRPIQIQFLRAEEARASVEKVFANRMQGSGGNSGNRAGQGTAGGSNQPQRGQPQPNPMMPEGGPPMPPGLQQMIQAMAQGGRGGGGTAREQEPPMTLDVHVSTNSLIVSATESLFKEVKAYVEEIDAMAAQQVNVIEPVVLDYVTTALAQQSLENLLGTAVTFRTNNQARQTQMGGFGGGMGGGGVGGGIAGGKRGGGGGGNPFMNILGGGMRPGGTVGGGMPNIGGGGASPIMNMLGGGMRPGGNIGGGMPNVGGAGVRPGGNIGGGMPNFGGAGQRPGGIGGGMGR